MILGQEVIYVPKPELGIVLVVDPRPGKSSLSKITMAEFEAIKSPVKLYETGDCRETKPGWGDRLATALKAMGVTEDGYKEVKAKFGLPPTCGCKRRREWFNRVELWVKGKT